MSPHGHVSKKTISVVLRPWKTVITSPGVCWMVLFPLNHFPFVQIPFAWTPRVEQGFQKSSEIAGAKNSSRTGGISKWASLLRVENFRIFWSLYQYRILFSRNFCSKFKCSLQAVPVDCHFVWWVPLDPSVSQKNF